MGAFRVGWLLGVVLLPLEFLKKVFTYSPNLCLIYFIFILIVVILSMFVGLITVGLFNWE